MIRLERHCVHVFIVVLKCNMHIKLHVTIESENQDYVLCCENNDFEKDDGKKKEKSCLKSCIELFKKICSCWKSTCLTFVGIVIVIYIISEFHFLLFLFYFRNLFTMN